MSANAQIVLTTVGAGIALVLLAAAVLGLLNRLTGLRDRTPGHTRHTPIAARRRQHPRLLPRTVSGVPSSPRAAPSRTPTPVPPSVLTREAR